MLLTNFKNNFLQKESPELLINEKHAIIVNNPHIFYYEDDDDILTPINYLAFLEVINNGKKITKIESCKLEALINNRWTELLLLHRESYNYRDKPSYITDYMYANINNNLEKCSRIDYFSFTAQAIFNEVIPGQKINGWLTFQWNPLLIDENHDVKIDKVRYTFITNQGHTISKVIVINNKAKELGEFSNKYNASWSISEQNHDLSNRIITTPYIKENLNTFK